MTVKISLLFFFFTFYVIGCYGQRDETMVKIASWSKGSETISEHSLRIVLNSEKPKYEKRITTKSGRVYELLVQPNYLKDLKGQNWKVELRTIILDDRKETLGDDLLLVERPGGGGDNFPRENLIGYFYPNDLHGIAINGVFWVEGVRPLYPLKVVRKIQVDGFWVTIKTVANKYEEKKGARASSLELCVEFSNSP